MIPAGQRRARRARLQPGQHAIRRRLALRLPTPVQWYAFASVRAHVLRSDLGVLLYQGAAAQPRDVVLAAAGGMTQIGFISNSAATPVVQVRVGEVLSGYAGIEELTKTHEDSHPEIVECGRFP